MAEYTPNLNLLKKDPATDGNDTFNIKTMLNDNWDIIDTEIGNLKNIAHGAVADITALKAIDTTDMPDNITIIVKSLGFYRFDSTSTLTPDDKGIVQPAVGSGRWINDLAVHQAESATQDGYGHIRLQDIPSPEIATQTEAETGTNNTKMMTPLRVYQAIDNKVRIVDSDLLEMNIGGELKQFSLTPVAFIDNTNAPGSKYAIAGDWNAGYFGVVPMSELITGDSLASKIGLSAGTSQFSSTAGWLKFAYNGKIQFVARKPLRHSISWDNINSANAVYGDKTIVIDGLTYKVRLMRGANKDPASARSGSINHGSEWNKLMLPIHIQAKDGNWAYPGNVEPNIPYWGTDFPDEDLLTHSNYGSGSRSWCQEVAESSDRRLIRGSFGVSVSDSNTSSSVGSSVGWRPVLELVF